MCFGDKKNDPSPSEVTGARPAGQIPLQGQTSSKPMPPSEYAPPPGPPPSHLGGAGAFDYAPPAGPPPGLSGDFAPPPGPPPSKAADNYGPPAGPPPGRGGDDFAPPPGPPPGHPPADEEKPKHAWEEAVPDTSLFPPPPAFFTGHDRSWANNATEAEAEAGEAWCVEHPMASPQPLDQAAVTALRDSNFRLMTPVAFGGAVEWLGKGRWRGHTVKDSRDACTVAYPPLYSVRLHSPLAAGNPKKTIYFEVRLAPKAPASSGRWGIGGSAANKDDEVSVALGFVALPYPGFRLPGWHRGSLAVHGDDGHKYINDRWGGNDFTGPFKKGETVGLGMVLEQRDGRVDVDIFFTRQGLEQGRWNLHQETDAQADLPVTGLEGFHDLSAAIGTFDATAWEAVFDPEAWAWQGWRA